MGSSERWDQPRASATGQSNVQFAAKTPIAVTVIGFCPITRIFVGRQASREGRRRPHRRRTGECLWPGPASAGASSAVGLTPPDLVGNSRHRRWQGGRHRPAAARPQLVHLSVRSQGGCPLSVNRGVAVVAVLLILEREEVPGAPLDDWQGLVLPRRATRLRTNRPLEMPVTPSFFDCRAVQYAISC